MSETSSESDESRTRTAAAVFRARREVAERLRNRRVPVGVRGYLVRIDTEVITTTVFADLGITLDGFVAGIRK